MLIVLVFCLLQHMPFTFVLVIAIHILLEFSVQFLTLFCKLHPLFMIKSISVIIYLLFNLVFSSPCKYFALLFHSFITVICVPLVKEMGRLVTRQTILVLFIFCSHLNLGACAGFALANCDWLGRTIAFY